MSINFSDLLTKEKSSISPNTLSISKGRIDFSDLIYGREIVGKGQIDFLDLLEPQKTIPEIRALRTDETFKPVPFKPKPIGYTIEKTKEGKWKEGIDPFIVLGNFIERHPLAMPLGIVAPAFTATSLALEKLPRASKVLKSQIEKLPEAEGYFPSDLGFVGQQSLRTMRGKEPITQTRYPRQEATMLLDAVQNIAEYAISGKVESIASRKLLENSLKVLGGKLTDAGYGLGKIEIPRETITKIGNYTPSGQSLLLNIQSRRIKIPPRPPIPTVATEKGLEAVVKPFSFTPQFPIARRPPVNKFKTSMPEVITTEQLFKQTPEDIARTEFEKGIDEYMTGEPGKGNLYSIIKAEGGISPYAKTTAGGLKEEYRENVPLVLRRKLGLPLDEMAYALSERYPHLGVTDESSLLEALEKEKLSRKQPGAGGIAHIFPQKLAEKGIAIIGRDNTIRISQDTDATDIYGNKMKLPRGEEYTPYKLSNQQILLQDGEQIVINKNQFQNIKGKNMELGEKVSPEEAQVEEVVKGGELKELPAFAKVPGYSGIGEGEATNIGSFSIDIKKVGSKYLGNVYSPYENNAVLSVTGNTKEDVKSKLLISINSNEKLMKDANISKTKFSQYQLPGGENYKEVLFKTPYSEQKQKDFLTGKSTEKDVFFKSPHWDEPNVISHARINDRTTPDGKKILFIEEIQSDWARAIRDAKIPEEAIVKMYPPEHPLLKNWQEFTLKRLVDYAVKNGYDGISWTTGEQQAERYDLSKHIGELNYHKVKTPEGYADEVRVVALTPDLGQVEIDKTVKLSGNELDNLVGKEVAQRIRDDVGKSRVDKYGMTGTLKGLDLKIGGEWAKNLYDKQIPNILKDLTKGEVGSVNLGRHIAGELRIIEGPDNWQVYTTEELNAGGMPEKEFDTKIEAQNFINKNKVSLGNQPALMITPEIRARVIGQPMAGGMIHKLSEAGEVNIEIFTAPFKAIATKLDAVQYQVKHPISKSIVSDIQHVNLRAHRGAAEWLMRVDYFRGLKKEYDTLLTDLMEGKHIDLPKEEFNKLFVLKQKLRKSLEEAWQRANSVGVKVKITDEEGTHWRPIGKIENYVPREIHPDIKEQLDGGLKQLYDKMLELRDRGVKDNVKQAILSAKKSGNTYVVRLLKWLEEKDMKMSASTLVRLIDKLIHRDYIASYGHLERPRMIEEALPPEFYERRSSVLFTRYFASAARRIAEIERFGQTNEKLLRRLRFVERVSPQEGRILRDLLHIYQDKTKHELVNMLASIISTIKIGMGTSTIPNITQTLISTIPKQGVFNFLRGALNLIVDPQTKLFIQKTGLPYTDVVRGIVGYENYGLLGKVNDLLLTANWFKGVNRLNAMLTASSTERWIKKGLLPASYSSFPGRKQWALDNLEKLRIYPKDIVSGNVSDEKLIDAMYIAASNYQLFSDITNEPLFLSKPENRWVTVLKRFGYKQPLLVMHQIIYDELKHANPLPLLRLIAGGILGGAFVIWGNRKIYDTVSWIKEETTGEAREPPDWYSKWDAEDRTIYEKALDLMAQAGVVGMLSDITRVDSQNKWSLSRQLDFQLTPVIISEAVNAGSIIDVLTKGETKKGRRTIEIPPEERIKKALQKVSREFPITKFLMEKE